MSNVSETHVRFVLTNVKLRRLAAANRPPHLCGIMVQDAFTDFYREVAFKGGVYHGNFIDDLTKVYCPHGNAEKSLMVSLPQACQKYPHYNDFWRLYTADIEKIECPVYLITSLADNGVHTPGSIRGYMAAKSKVKYLEMHP